MSHLSFLFLFYFFLSLLILREREREGAHTCVREGQRERENPKQALHSRHKCQCMAWTQELWDHDLSQNQELDVQQTEPPRCPSQPLILSLLLWCYIFLSILDQSLRGPVKCAFWFRVLAELHSPGVPFHPWGCSHSGGCAVFHLSFGDISAASNWLCLQKPCVRNRCVHNW